MTATETSVNYHFDEEWYLTEYADVKKAVLEGWLASGFEHFETYGRAEGRKPHAPVAPGALEKLSELGFEQAAGLRWALRDIQAKRPIDSNRLVELKEFGLVQMRGADPILTNVGMNMLTSGRPA
jgi:hypothetical protein